LASSLQIDLQKSLDERQHIRQEGDRIDEIQKQMAFTLHATPSQPPTQISQSSTGCVLSTPSNSSLELALTSACTLHRHQQQLLKRDQVQQAKILKAMKLAELATIDRIADAYLETQEEVVKQVSTSSVSSSDFHTLQC
jgi:hypothetical protein